MQENTQASAIERYFKIREKGTSVRTEILAGLTTFIALAYIIFVNPNILAEAGIPKEAAIASTIWIAALSTMVMGVVANYPVALAPGMGLNAFFAYYVCGTLGLHWTVALGAVFFSGVLFLILTVSHIRQAIINAVPQNLRVAIGVGIGQFIAFIGLKGTGLIIPDKATFIGLGHVTNPTTMLSLFGLVLTGALMARNIQGSILIGIVVTTLLSMVLGYSPVPHGIGDIISTSLPHMGETFGQLDIMGAWNYGIVSIIFTFTVVEILDKMGPLNGHTSKAKLVKPNGEIENLDRALTTDAVGTIFSSIFGTSTVTSYIESAAGIAAGGKTGLTAVTVSICFLIALLFAPLVGLVPGFATAPPLILVGALMMADVGKINFQDFSDGLPAFLTIIMMPLTGSIANGFAFGFVSFAFMKTAVGKYKEVSWIMWLVSIAFIINLVMRS
ncbi:NCS2 family permease [Selenomonas sp.]|uniref:NCS2 family permease n=1 Tax=Selenomonas sp. TaxID=2053611 RepID=UPI002A74CF96|nr:NCS2 family permease [Selenomonas sp.]MDY3297524.1 NCS2 family permease [Selenomonas sp.]